jgi:FkbM family methyltransferase
MQTIIDVGMHVGKDTQFYLDKGFRVVAVEARPDFVAQNRVTFKSYIDDGRLEIVHGAVSDRAGTIPFTIFPDQDDWGTCDPHYTQLYLGRKKRYDVIDVPAVRFDDILRRVGIPYYLKIDIEGSDLLCVKALHGFAERPAYVSAEVATTGFDRPFETIAHLYVLGYRRFKVVNQALFSRRRCPHPPREGSFVDASFDWQMTGPFGEEAPGAWNDAERTLATLRRIVRKESLFAPEGRLRRFAKVYDAVARRMGGEPIGWYDVHAAR